MRSIEAARSANTYFAFCASLRGLVESSADSYYSLQFAPINLARYFAAIERSVRGEADDKVYAMRDLENWGLHFIAAGKYDDPSMPKETYKARPSWQYLKAIDAEGEFKPVYSLYEQLCQITHPSRESTYLYLRDAGGPWTVSDVDEAEEIDRVTADHDKAFEDVFQKAFNTALIVLWIIDKLGVEGTQCPAIREINMSMIETFRVVSREIRKGKAS